jgi:hypothetical protein
MFCSLKTVLFPSLLLCCLNSKSAKAIISADMSTRSLVQFATDTLDDIRLPAPTDASAAVAAGSEGSRRMRAVTITHRIPAELLRSAVAALS